MCRVHLRQFDAAVEDGETAVRLAPYWPQAYRRLSSALYMAKRTSRAFSVAVEALKTMDSTQTDEDLEFGLCWKNLRDLVMLTNGNGRSDTANEVALSSIVPDCVSRFLLCAVCGDPLFDAITHEPCGLTAHRLCLDWVAGRAAGFQAGAGGVCNDGGGDDEAGVEGAVACPLCRATNQGGDGHSMYSSRRRTTTDKVITVNNIVQAAVPQLEPALALAEEAWGHFERGTFDLCVTACDRSTAEFPLWYVLHLRVMAVLKIEGWDNVEKVVEPAQRLVRLAPWSKSSRLLLIRIFIRQGASDQACATFLDGLFSLRQHELLDDLVKNKLPEQLISWVR